MRYLTDVTMRFVCSVHNCDLVDAQNYISITSLTAVSLVNGILEFDLSNWLCPIAASKDEGKQVNDKWEADSCICEVVWEDGTIRTDDRDIDTIERLPS